MVEERDPTGDPLGPLLFSLGLRRLTAALPATPRSVWYLDDGTLGGPISLVKAAFDRVVSFAGTIGMTVNVAKTEVCPISGPFDVDSICAAFGGAKVIPYSELELLGSPIGPIDSPDQLSGSVEIHLEQIATLGQSLQGLSSHHRLFLLNYCVGIPRLLYMIRSSPCFLVPEVLRNIDASFRQFLTETLNIQLDDKAWRQASLPVKAGGLGVRRIEDLALPAYLSSSVGLLVSAALEAWFAAAGNGVDPPTQPSASRQSSWDTPLVTHALKDLLSGASDQDALRLRSVSAEDGGGGANGWEHIHRPSAGPCSPTKRSGLLQASGSVLRSYLFFFFFFLAILYKVYILYKKTNSRYIKNKNKKTTKKNKN